MDRIQIDIGTEYDGRTVAGVLKDKFLMSRTLLRKIKREGQVTLNEKQSFLSARVKEGDTLGLIMEFDEKSDLLPDYSPLEVVYQDRCLLVVNKPAGMLVHPVTGEDSGTLANLVMGHWMGRGKARPVYRPVFRIDRDTSGLVLIAGSRLAHNSLDGQLRGGTLQRKYIAVAHGRISKGEGVIDLPLARKKGSTVEREISPEGVRAITHYRLLKYLPPIDASVLELWLETGRTHQIRAHLSHLGHPLLGDGLYGGDTGLIKRQALHSCNIAFSHPQTGEKMNLRSKLPGDMEKITGAMTME